MVASDLIHYLFVYRAEVLYVVAVDDLDVEAADLVAGPTAVVEFSPSAHRDREPTYHHHLDFVSECERQPVRSMIRLLSDYYCCHCHVQTVES